MRPNKFETCHIALVTLNSYRWKAEMKNSILQTNTCLISYYFRSVVTVESRTLVIHATTVLMYLIKKSCSPDSMWTFTRTAPDGSIIGNHLIRKYYPIWHGSLIMKTSLARMLLLWRMKIWRNMVYSRLETVFR